MAPRSQALARPSTGSTLQVAQRPAMASALLAAASAMDLIYNPALVAPVTASIASLTAPTATACQRQAMVLAMVSSSLVVPVLVVMDCKQQQEAGSRSAGASLEILPATCLGLSARLRAQWDQSQQP